MSSDSFRLNERQLLELIDSQAAEGISPTLETLVVGYSGDPELHEAPLAEQLAHYVWLLATHGAIELPDRVPPHGLLGHFARGPERDDALVIEVRCEEGPRIASGPIGPEELVSPTGPESPERVIEELIEAARRIAAWANQLLPAARAAAR